MDKVKKNLIVQAKVKKQYAKVKAKHQQEEAAKEAQAKAPATSNEGTQDVSTAADEPEQQIHPDRQAMLDDETSGEPDQGPDSNPNPYPGRQPRDQDRSLRKGQRPRQPRRPGYFDKSLEEAARKQAEAEARAKEARERRKEWERRVAEREQYRKAMAKARTPGVDGKRRLGRESKLLLDRVKKMVGEKK